MPWLTSGEIAQKVGGELEGPADLVIRGAQTLEEAQEGDISFLGDPKYLPQWEKSRASAVLVDRRIAVRERGGRAIIRVENADLAMALVLEALAPPVVHPRPGVHPTAQVDASAQLGKDVAIGPFCVIGAGVVLGDRTILHAHVTILDQTVVGPDCVFWPGVVVRERCRIGARCILHPNVVIGADGFGYRPSLDGQSLVKIPHIGTVELGDDVELGAGTCVDRGKFAATVIGSGTKVDNLCQIGHNVRIGRNCVLSGQVGLAGSVVLEDGVMLGGKVGVRDHVRIGAGAKVMGYAAVMDDIPAGEVWGGYPAQERRAALREHLAVRKLPELMKRLEEWLNASRPGAQS